MQRPTPARPIPDKDAINALPAFARLNLKQITVVTEVNAAREAAAALRDHQAWGFDTESKPTFRKDEVSDGPHVLQLATRDHAWVILLHDTACRDVACELLAAPAHVKAGFGLGDDKRRIESKLGVTPANVLELNTVFHDRGYRKDMGVKAAVAVLFDQRFMKSKKAATSNWAAPRLTESQVLYAANDAWAAIEVFHALRALD
ncbi:3'-5' exonuclease [Hydrogenophaga sp. 5NK40-0174]|uniref:3'-5' exonuclease n=1 Tax=Hydrogenophaga sp. 5NK40-0174 TaxID=3127649 RepID=UPI00310C068A